MSFSFNVVAHLKSLLRHTRDYIESIKVSRPATDIQRWQEPTNLKPEWDERTAKMAGYIQPGSSVIEFGAARLVLPLYLPPGCSYQPVDLVQRSEQTIVIDLNGPLPKLPQRYDVAVFSGVLEYVREPTEVLRWLEGAAERVLFSYAVADKLSDPITRRRNGWVNSYTDASVRRIIRNAGLECIKTDVWQNQHIYLCRFTGSMAATDARTAGED
jgi:hypothetical protein